MARRHKKATETTQPNNIDSKIICLRCRELEERIKQLENELETIEYTTGDEWCDEEGCEWCNHDDLTNI